MIQVKKKIQATLYKSSKKDTSKFIQAKKKIQANLYKSRKRYK